MVKILVVEDNDVIRETLVELIDMEDDFIVVGAAENGSSACKLLSEGMVPDIIVTDLNMPEMDGIKLTQVVTAQYDNIKVIVLTMHDRKAFADHAFGAGAHGFLLKNGDMNELFSAIKIVFHGETVVGAGVASKK